MKRVVPKPLELSHFVSARNMLTSIPQWRQVTDWQRDGLLSVKPLSADHVTVTLTPKGRAALGMEGEQ